MRLPGGRVLAVVGGVGAVVAAPYAQVRADDFQISFAAGSRDVAALAVNGLPSCQVTPSRSGKVSSVPSSLHDH